MTLLRDELDACLAGTDDDRPPLPRAKRCLEEDLLPAVQRVGPFRRVQDEVLAALRHTQWSRPDLVGYVARKACATRPQVSDVIDVMIESGELTAGVGVGPPTSRQTYVWRSKR